MKIHSYTSRARLIALAAGITLYQLVASSADLHAQSPEELQKHAANNDAVILDLVRRIEVLEARLSQAAAANQGAKQTGEPTQSSGGVPPGDEETSRALERTLVREGGLLLPPGAFEVEPRYSYTYHSSDALQIVNLNGQETIARQKVKQDRQDLSLNLRLGLPWSSQLDFRLPYVFDRHEISTAALERQKSHHSGLGDTELGWTKQLFRERGWTPDLLASVNWKNNNGDHDLGNGFHGIQAGLTAVKRRDPLALFGTISHDWSLSDKQAGNDVDAGNTIGIKSGAILATSPDTALRFALEVNRSRRAEINREKIPGSNSVVGLFEFGVATLAFPRTLLDLRAGIGLTSESPDFRFDVSLPLRLY
jgi:hypothetical protein